MASTSIIPPVFEMAELRSHGIGVPILFPIDAHGIIVVSELHLSIRFSFKPSTIWVVSTKILAPLQSSTAAFSTPPVISVKTEPGVDNVIDFFDSLNEDVPVQKVVVHDSDPLFPYASYVSPSPSRFVPLSHSVPSTSKPPQPIVQCLRCLGSQENRLR